MKRRVLILSFSSSRREPRVMRQVRLLENDFELTVVGHGDSPDAQVEFIPMAASNPAAIPPTLKRMLKLILGQFDPRRLRSLAKILVGRFEAYYWGQWEVRRSLELLVGRSFDLVIAHDVLVLPVALRIAGNAPVLYDAHEYAPRQNEESITWRMTTGRLYRYLCKCYLARAAAMVTVAEGIANEYRSQYGVDAAVVRNTPRYQDMTPTPVLENRVKLIHHGDASPSRRIETFIETMRFLDERYTLDLMLVGSDDQYLQKLRKMAASDPRIRIIPPVPMDEICRTINTYDVGLLCIPPVSFNQEHCLPNKVFEYVQARLAIATGPSPEVVRIVSRMGLGVVAESFEAMDFAKAVGGMTRDSLVSYKAAADEAANKLSFECDGAILRELVDRLVD